MTPCPEEIALAAPAIAKTSPFTTLRGPRRPIVECDPADRDPLAAAKVAGLHHVTDDSPGIRRHKHGKSFRYTGIDGKPLRDRAELARIKAIVIPPAWTDVWICPRSDGHLQATGRDDRGRKQYRYHPAWRAVRDESKYGRLLAFGQCLPKLRAQVEADLKRPGLPREKVIAAVVSLLEQTLIRVGNDEYARTNGSHGLTTFEDDHVEISGAKVTFAFHGKSGKEHTIGLKDRRLANVVRRCREIPGQALFQYLDEAGTAHTIGSADVNDYLRAVCDQEFTAKDFRTWSGTLLAVAALAPEEPAESERERTKQIARAVANVAERLGNTVNVCRKCYIHPVVLDAFGNGRLNRLAGATRSGSEDDGSEPMLFELLQSEHEPNVR